MSTSCLASITPCKGFLTLVASQFRLAAHNNSSGFGAFLAFALRIKPKPDREFRAQRVQANRVLR